MAKARGELTLMPTEVVTVGPLRYNVPWEQAEPCHCTWTNDLSQHNYIASIYNETNTKILKHDAFVFYRQICEIKDGKLI